MKTHIKHGHLILRLSIDLSLNAKFKKLTNRVSHSGDSCGLSIHDLSIDMTTKVNKNNIMMKFLTNQTRHKLQGTINSNNNNSKNYEQINIKLTYQIG